jgi:hypothetical protein
MGALRAPLATSQLRGLLEDATAGTIEARSLPLDVSLGVRPAWQDHAHFEPGASTCDTTAIDRFLTSAVVAVPDRTARIAEQAPITPSSAWSAVSSPCCSKTAFAVTNEARWTPVEMSGLR